MATSACPLILKCLQNTLPSEGGGSGAGNEYGGGGRRRIKTTLLCCVRGESVYIDTQDNVVKEKEEKGSNLGTQESNEAEAEADGARPETDDATEETS